jgi:hypothetical protein
MRIKMKKKITNSLAVVSLFFSIFEGTCVAQEAGPTPQAGTPQAEPGQVGLPTQPGIPEAAPGQLGGAPATAGAPPASPPPAMPPAMPPAEHEVKKVNINKPLVPESQYFYFRGLNSARVTLKSLKALDCNLLRRIYQEDPQRALDHVSLLLLIQRVLEGADVRNMPEQDRIDLTYATVLGELRKYGRFGEARGYMGLSCDECFDRIVIPSVAALCQVLEGVKGAILLELYHYKLIFPVSS